jgi:hypothetical protein
MGLFSKSTDLVVLKDTEADLRDQVTKEAAALAEVERTLAQLKSDLADEENDIALGYDEARLRLPLLQKDIEAQNARAGEIRVRKSAIEQRLGQIQRSREEAEELDRRRRIPGLAAKQYELAAKVEKHAAALGEAMRELEANGVRLVDALKVPEARRLFGVGALTERMRGTLYKDFIAARPSLPAAAVAQIGQHIPWRFLDWPIQPMSPMIRSTMSAEERRAIDSVVRVFATKSDAEAARSRIDPSAATLHVLPDQHGLFHLVEGRLRGSALRRPNSATLPAPGDGPDKAA